MCLFGFSKLFNDFPSLPSRRWILKSLIIYKVSSLKLINLFAPVQSHIPWFFFSSHRCIHAYFFTVITNTSIRYEQRFLSCMAFSVYDFDRLACKSRSWFVRLWAVSLFSEDGQAKRETRKGSRVWLMARDAACTPLTKPDEKETLLAVYWFVLYALNKKTSYAIDKWRERLPGR